MHRSVKLKDGTPVILRLLLPTDRDELARSYDQLSQESRRLRFFSPPARLSQSHLDYLTELDYNQRFALVAYAQDDQRMAGLGVARWVRDRDDPTRAEAAVTVVDDWQGRGLGTQLVLALIDEARSKGITTFVADVLWENDAVLEPLRRLGARVQAEGPGVARVELDLPATDDEFTNSAIRHVLAVSGGGPRSR